MAMIVAFDHVGCIAFFNMIWIKCDINVNRNVLRGFTCNEGVAQVYHIELIC